MLDGDDLSIRTLKYAADLCKRLGGQLEILHKQGPGQVDITTLEAWQEFTSREGLVAYNSLKYDESLDDKLTEYGKKRRDILCVALKIHLMDKGPDKKNEANVWSPDWIMEKLNCPVMVYS